MNLLIMCDGIAMLTDAENFLGRAAESVLYETVVGPMISAETYVLHFLLEEGSERGVRGDPWRYGFREGRSTTEWINRCFDGDMVRYPAAITDGRSKRGASDAVIINYSRRQVNEDTIDARRGRAMDRRDVGGPGRVWLVNFGQCGKGVVPFVGDVRFRSMKMARDKVLAVRQKIFKIEIAIEQDARSGVGVY